MTPYQTIFRSRAHRPQRGFSLLEVLISVVVLTLGALGAAGMQLSALKDTGSAFTRYRAASLATGMADALRADRTLAIGGSPAFVSALTNGTCASIGASPVAQWQNQIDCELPGGKGAVELDTVTKRAIVTVEWDDSRGRGGSTAQQFRIEARL